MVDKIIDPTLDDFIGQDRRELFELLRLSRRLGLFTGHPLELQVLDDPVFYDDLNFTLKTAISTMNVNRLMLVRVKENYDSKILIKLRHKSHSLKNNGELFGSSPIHSYCISCSL